MITCSSAAPNGVNRDIAENQRKHLKAIRAKIEEKADGQKDAHNGIQKQIKMERLLRFRKGCGVRAEQGCFPLAGSNRSTPFVFYAASCTRKQKRNSTPEQAGAAEYTRYPTVSAFGAPGKGVTRCFFPQYLSCLIPTPCSNRKFRTRTSVRIIAFRPDLCFTLDSDVLVLLFLRRNPVIWPHSNAFVLVPRHEYSATALSCLLNFLYFSRFGVELQIFS